LIELNDIYNIDCLLGMKKLEEKSVDLIIADIPYNVTDFDWDKFEDNIEYLSFLSKFFFQCNKILKTTGSLYIFHSDFPLICEIQNLVVNSTGLEFKQLIVWNKFFDGCKNHYLKYTGMARGFLHNYERMAEYILFYTFPEKRNISSEYKVLDNFKSYKSYVQSILNKNKLTYNSDKIVRTLFEKIGYKSMQSARGISQRLFNFNFKNFGIMSNAQYDVLYDILHFDKSYSEIYQLFLDDKNANIIPEKEKRIFHKYNNLGSHHSVWNYNEVSKDDMIHPTEKPLELIENIILHSSDENDLILDPFSGSGVSAVACIKNNRNYICFEKDKKYYEDSMKRIENYRGGYA
jgi:DNA modification methylase